MDLVPSTAAKVLVLLGCASFLGLLVLLMVLSAIGRRFFPRPPQGIHFGALAAAWAEQHFAPEYRPVAAFVADVLCEQLGVKLIELAPQTSFTDDLFTDLEPVEVVMVLEEDLDIEIPDEDSERLQTIAQLVHYLYERLAAKSQLA